MRRMLVVILFLLAWTLGACGSVAVNVPPTAGPGDPPTASVPTAVSATLNVTMSDDMYDAATYTVPAGALVTVNVTNQGAAPHTFDILKKGEHLVTYQAEDEEKILWQLSVPAGATSSGTFNAPDEPGEYQIICHVAGHLLTGMEATLIVE